MATPSKSSIFLLFALFVTVSFSNVQVGTSARLLLQLPAIPNLPPLPTTGVVPAIPAVPVPFLPKPPIEVGVAGVPVPIPGH
ncbi:hypothetical protein LINGRAHAP2_LOCUS28065 [Linum grandiflorum]